MINRRRTRRVSAPCFPWSLKIRASSVYFPIWSRRQAWEVELQDCRFWLWRPCEIRGWAKGENEWAGWAAEFECGWWAGLQGHIREQGFFLTPFVKPPTHSTQHPQKNRTPRQSCLRSSGSQKAPWEGIVFFVSASHVQMTFKCSPVLFYIFFSPLLQPSWLCSGGGIQGKWECPAVCLRRWDNQGVEYRQSPFQQEARAFLLLFASYGFTLTDWRFVLNKRQAEPEPYYTFRGHMSMVLSLAVSDLKGGTPVCYSGSADGSIRSWRIPPVNQPIYTPFGQYLSLLPG